MATTKRTVIQEDMGLWRVLGGPSEASIAAALSMLGSTPATLLLYPTTWAIGSSLAVTQPIWMGTGGTFAVTPGQTLTLQANEVIYPEWFGLKASGSTADRAANTAALQAAHDALPATGGIIQLPPATTGKEIYLSQVNFTKPLYLRACGIDATTLVAETETVSAFHCAGNNMVFEDFTLHGGSNANPGVIGIHFDGYSHHVLNRVRVTSFLGTDTSINTRGIGVQKSANANGGFFLTMRNSESPANGLGLKFTTADGIPVTYTSLIDCKMTSNLVHALYDDVASFTYGLYIQGGHYAFNGAEAWNIRPSQFCIIAPNLEDNGGATYEAIFTSPGTNTVFAGTVIGLSVSSLSFYPGTWSSGGYYMVNGVLMSTPETGVSTEPAIQVRGNVEFNGEKLYINNDAGIGFVDSGGVYKALFTRSNTRQAIVGNISAVGSPSSVALRAPSPAPTVDLTTSGFRIGSAGAQIKAINSGTVSVDPGSIAAGTRGTATATISGVAAGDRIVLEPPTALDAGLVFVGARVTAPDTVSIYLYNASASPVDDAALSWNYLWIDLT